MNAIQIIPEPSGKHRLALPLDYVRHDTSSIILDTNYISATSEDSFHETNNPRIFILYGSKQEAEEVAAKMALVTGLPVWPAY